MTETELDDAEIDRLKDRWLAEYRAAFVAYAITRSWTRENAEAWASEIEDDAFIDCLGTSIAPQAMAEIDVRACEREADNAD